MNNTFSLSDLEHIHIILYVNTWYFYTNTTYCIVYNSGHQLIF